MGAMIKIKFYYFSGFVGAGSEDVIEYDRDQWEQMTDREKWEECLQFAIEAGFEVSYEEVTD